jgi:hypothetical protein
MMPAVAIPAIVSRYRVSLVGQLAWDDAVSARDCKLKLRAKPSEGREYGARIRPDGLYFFENVAPGTYRLAGQDGKGRTLERTVTLPPVESGDRPPVIELDLQFTKLLPADNPPADVPAPRAPRGRGARAARTERK